MHNLSEILSVVAPALTATLAIPQAIHIHRFQAYGVSRGTWLLTMVVAELWCAYGFVFKVPAEVAANVLEGILAGLVLMFAARDQHAVARARVETVAATLIVASLISASVLDHNHLLLSVAAVSGALCLYLPQMVKVLRENEVSGVSLISWVIALLTALSWGVYGLLIHQLAISLPNTVMFPSSLVIVIRLWLYAPNRKLAAADSDLEARTLPSHDDS